MATITRTTPRKRNLGVETLESRLNLSTLSSLATPVAPQTTGLTTSSITNTTTATNKLISVTPADTSSSSSTEDPYANLKFGDTTVPTSGTTNVNVYDYSSIQNASMNWSNPANIGNMASSGVNIEYKLNTSASGTYRIQFDVAAVRWGSFDLYVNNTKQASYSFLASGSWNSYLSTMQDVSLGAGANTIRITPTWGSQFNISAIKVTPTSVSSSSNNNSNNNSSSTSNTSSNNLSSSITLNANQNSGISNAILENASTTPNIGGMGTNGAYVDYTLNVASAGTYNLSANVAANSWAAMGVSINGGAASEIDINSTGGWASYKAVSGQVYLSAGTVKIRVSNLYGTQFNLRSLSLSSTSSTSTTTTNNNSNNNSNSSSTNYVGSSTATITADKYSALSNAYLENKNGMNDIGGMATSGASVEYTLNVASAGSYTLSAQTALPSWAAMGVSVNGGAVTEIDMNATGGWASFKSVSGQVYLPAGTVKLKFTNLYGTQFNLGTFTLTPGGSANNNNNNNTYTPPANNTPSTPQSPDSWSSGSASVSTNWMTSFNQLTITGTSGADSIYVSQSGNTISVTAGGKTTSYSGSYGNIVVKGGDGNDTITIASSVNIDTLIYGGSGNDTLQNLGSGHNTIVAIGGGYDTLQGNGWSTSYWADTSDAVNAGSSERNAGRVHQVASFWNGVSTELNGQNLSDPSGTGATTRLTSSSFWGTGPKMEDVVQGQLADCWVVGALQTMAFQNPDRLRELAVDLGDGTYAIQFTKNGATQYVRVDGDLAANGPYANGINYAHPGASGNQWAAIFEKAYAEIGTGAWSYSSLNYGWFGGVLSSLGYSVSSFSTSDPNSLYNSISNALNSGKGVTLGTAKSVWNVPLIGDHTYTAVKAWKDSSGTGWVTLRNPWGYDGAGWDSNTNDGYVTLTVNQLAPFLTAGTVS
jgi:hypothetical protein